MKAGKSSLIKSGIIVVLSLLFMMVNPFQTAEAALGNGVYSVPYTVIKPDDGSASMADGYLVKPATVTVKDGSYTVKLTIKNSSWITEFKPNGANPSVISTSGDTRTVQFQANITSPVVTRMKVDIDDMNYHHEYTVRLSFNTGGAKLISGGEEKPKEETKEEVKQEQQKETTTASKTETSTKEKVSESKSASTSKQTETQSNKQNASSAAKITASSESTKASDKSDEKVSEKASAENVEKTVEDRDTEAADKDEEVTQEESEKKEAVKEEETEDKEDKEADAEESKQSLNTESSVKETASANIEEEEKGAGPVVWSILAIVIALGLGFGFYRYKVRKQ